MCALYIFGHEVMGFRRGGLRRMGLLFYNLSYTYVAIFGALLRHGRRAFVK